MRPTEMSILSRAGVVSTYLSVLRSATSRPGSMGNGAAQQPSYPDPCLPSLTLLTFACGASVVHARQNPGRRVSARWWGRQAENTRSRERAKPSTRMALIANVVICQAGEADRQRRSVAVGSGDGLSQGQRAPQPPGKLIATWPWAPARPHAPVVASTVFLSTVDVGRARIALHAGSPTAPTRRPSGDGGHLRGPGLR